MANKCSLFGMAGSLDCDHPPCKSKKTGMLGIVGSMTIIIGTFVAILSYPGYSMATWVSELGNTVVNTGATVFNLFLIIGGGILLFFPAAFAAIARNKLVSVGIIMSGAAAAIGTILVGVNPISFDPVLHEASATIAFAGMLFVSAFMMAAIFQSGGEHVPIAFGFVAAIQLALSILYAIIRAVMYAMGTFLVAAPIVEWLAVIAFVAGTFALGIYELV
jgi:hypothetical protein